MVGARSPAHISLGNPAEALPVQRGSKLSLSRARKLQRGSNISLSRARKLQSGSNISLGNPAESFNTFKTSTTFKRAFTTSFTTLRLMT